MTKLITTGAEAIEAAIAGEMRFSYGSATTVHICVYPQFEPWIPRPEFLKTYVDLGQRESSRLNKLLSQAALGPQDEWPAARQRILAAFYVANLSDEQLSLIADHQQNKDAA